MSSNLHTYDRPLFLTKEHSASDSIYSGPTRNLNLRAFAESSSSDLQPLQPQGLPKSQTVKKTGALYDVHSYWSKKPYLAIERFIRPYTRPGDLVFDPFCGCGSTLQAALGLGRKGIGIDISPSATHITANSLMPVDPDQLVAEATLVIRDVAQSLSALYTLEESKERYVIASLIHSESIRCVKCVRLFPILKAGTSHPHESCPHCGQSISTRARGVDFGPSSTLAAEIRGSYEARRGRVLWAGTTPSLAKSLELSDKARQKAEAIRHELAFPVPRRLIDLGGRLASTGSTTLGRLFEDRSITALYLLRQRILEIKNRPVRDKLMLAFTGVLKNCSKMYRFHEGGGGSPIGAYYVPPIRKELNPLFAFKDKVETIVRSLSEIGSWNNVKYLVSTQSSSRLDMPSNCVDYLFTDPPYADTMPFGALNFIWDGWLSPDWRWMDEEAIGQNWKSVLGEVFKEVHRVLKPSGFCSVCYHDTSEGTWMDLLDLMAEAGFRPVIGRDVLYIETTQRAYQQTVADKVVKRDHVVNFQKVEPKRVTPGREESDEKEPFREVAEKIICDILSEAPGMSKDRIYDLLTARLVAAGRIEPHDFAELLNVVAASSDDDNSRWFLRASEETVMDSAEALREDSAALKIESFILKWMKNHPEDEGVHYSDIFEFYLYSVERKPRRHMAEWLVDYFYRTEDGTWRLPGSEEEKKLKAQTRAAGTNRGIRRFAAMLSSGVAIPLEKIPSTTTLADWIRHAKRTGLFEVGKLLYERGGLEVSRLSEEMAVGVEEDYQVCVRALARSSGQAGATPKGKGRKGGQ